MSIDPSPHDPLLPGRLIAFRADRLGARLVSLLNAMRLAQDHGADFACAWIGTAGVGHIFNEPTELFRADFVARHFLDAGDWRAHRPDCTALTAQLQQRPGSVREVLASGQDLIVGNAFGIVCLAGEDRDKVTRRFRRQIARIPFVAPVRAAMRILSGTLRGCTAYHIRRGDLTGDVKAMNKAWPHKVVPDELYDVHIRKTLAKGAGGIVLFSDDPATIARYKARFPVLRTLPDMIDVRALTPAQRDLIELYAMSQCATIIAPGRSAFSSTAADLSGARRMDVTDELSPEDRQTAQMALFRRLRDRPESFAGPGEIGQFLAYLDPWLERTGRWREAADLFAARVADGLNISFIYPRTMGYQHRVGDVEAVIETAGLMRTRSVVHVRDQAGAEILHGYAHLRRAIQERVPSGTSGLPGQNTDARSVGLRHIVNGFWHAPTIAAARSVVPFLVENGLLHAGNFLPVSTLVRTLVTKRGPLKALLHEFPDLVTLPGMVTPQAIGSFEPVLWDWAPLMRSVSLSAEFRRGTIAKFARAIGSEPDDPGTAAERYSLVAFYAAVEGNILPAVDRLRDLAEHSPGDAMVHQRLSHALRLARDHAGAAGAAVQAAALAPDWPALRAWAGMTLIRTRRYEEAAAHLRVAATRRTGLASVHALLAQALQRLDDRAGALAEIEAALDLAPLEVGYVLLAARILDQTGRPGAAIGRLAPVVAADRAPARLYVLLIELLEKTGATAEAAEVARAARRRSPNHRAIADLAVRLAA